MSGCTFTKLWKWTRTCSYQLPEVNCLSQLLSRVRLFATPRTAAGQAPMSSTIPWSLLRFMSVCRELCHSCRDLGNGENLGQSSKSCDLWTHHLLPVSRPPLCGSPSFSGFPSDWWHKEGLLNHTFPKAVMQNRLYVTALLTAVSLSLFALEVLRFLQIMVDNDNASLKKKTEKADQ